MSDPFGDDDVDFEVEEMLETAYRNAIALINNDRKVCGTRLHTSMENPLTDSKDHFHVKPSLMRRQTALFSVDGFANLIEDPTKAANIITATVDTVASVTADTVAAGAEWTADAVLTPGYAPAPALSPGNAPVVAAAPAANYQLERLERARTQNRPPVHDDINVDLSLDSEGTTPLARRLKATSAQNREWASVNGAGAGACNSPLGGRSPSNRSVARSPSPTTMSYGEVYEPQYQALGVASPASSRAASNRGGPPSAAISQYADEAVANAMQQLAAAKPTGQLPNSNGGISAFGAIGGVFKKPGKK